jgi:hypothetical protein
MFFVFVIAVIIVMMLGSCNRCAMQGFLATSEREGATTVSYFVTEDTEILLTDCCFASKMRANAACISVAVFRFDSHPFAPSSFNVTTITTSLQIILMRQNERRLVRCTKDG